MCAHSSQQNNPSEERGLAIRISGTVQGVGFRPFVRNLATSLGLTGTVENTVRGVLIDAFGSRDALGNFSEQLKNSPPPLARIDSFTSEEIECVQYDAFRIVTSSSGDGRTVAVTPDAAICEDCRRELLDPNDRRHLYPFINCTHCGPRYSIIEDVPYDRPNTTMRDFAMCDACRAEYENPDDRRYHAQPVCCPDCGPQLSFHDADGKTLPGAPLANAIAMLHEGKTVAIKGLGGFHLACNAADSQAVRRLRERKHREEKPLAVMVKDLEAAKRYVLLDDASIRLLNSPASPIVIAPRTEAAPLAPEVAPVNRDLGIMLPYTPLHVLLFERGPEALVMTSANRSDEPICIGNDEALARLSGIADGFLMHDRRINLRVDDSVVAANRRGPLLIRRARGYVPTGFDTKMEIDGVIGFGPHMKNTLAIGRGRVIYPGQHIGDLDNAESLTMFDEVKTHLQEILGVEPTRAACDLQPDFPSTRLAEESGLPLTRVQHHHAHLAAAMMEHGKYDRAIGIAFDGTGYGDDGAIWGGEVFSFDMNEYRRAFHLAYVPLPGGDKAAKLPWRMALSHLHAAGLPWKSFIDHSNAENVAALIESGVPVPRTSSMGRLFDAVASLCGLCHEQSFDAKAPILLEAARCDTAAYYPFSLTDNGAIELSAMFDKICRDRTDKVPVPEISGRFHNTIVEIACACAIRLCEAEGLTRVFLSGGVFLNRLLAERLPERLEADGFTVCTHALLPPGDGAVSVGQVGVAAARNPA